MIIDMHLHSTHSVDADNTIFEMCERALQLKLDGICFTEHLDMNPDDPAYEYFDLKSYISDIKKAKAKYEKLIVLGGVEFCEPQSHPQTLKSLLSHNIDVVLASIHWLEGMMFGGGKLVNAYEEAKLYKKYYHKIKEMVEQGGFEVLAHLDLPKRYIRGAQGKYEHLNLVKNILQQIIKKDIALEINTSSLRKGMQELLPEEKILQLYSELGGTKVTLASDAHRVSEIAAGFDKALKLIEKYDFNCGYYQNRKFKLLDYQGDKDYD